LTVFDLEWLILWSTSSAVNYVASDPPPQRTLKQQILDQIAVLERELAALRALAQQLPD
jgi:hypothetical protein